MDFKEIIFPKVLPKIRFPADILLALPENSLLPLEQQHFLLYIPWQEEYLSLVPEEFQDFYKQILPYLRVRTTDVHTAISLSYLDLLLNRINKPINRRVVALSLCLHDVGWSKLTEEEIANSLGTKGLKINDATMGPKEKHAVEGEKIARKILTSYQFKIPLTSEEIDLICKGVLYHDKPESVAGSKELVPLEMQVLIDLDHLWSFTHENFWQDSVRKDVAPREYLQNLTDDLDSYFVTTEGKTLARELLTKRAAEVKSWERK